MMGVDVAGMGLTGVGVVSLKGIVRSGWSLCIELIYCCIRLTCDADRTQPIRCVVCLFILWMNAYLFFPSVAH